MQSATALAMLANNALSPMELRRTPSLKLWKGEANIVQASTEETPHAINCSFMQLNVEP